MATNLKERQAAENGKGGLSTATGTGSNTCVISKDTVIEGNFSAEQDVRIDGTIKGDVRCTKRIVIGETGKVVGKVNAESAVVMRAINGEIAILDLLQLKATALVDGNLQAKSILVEEGGRYLGECRVGTK
ncbi:MAG: polymer-forming cytoskeletal protein [Saprospirales bacterium]|nr:polymer-forming cytoskeletal protein [Saprospirales bacterium]